MLQLKHVAVLAATALAISGPKSTNGWVAQRRDAAEISAAFDTPTAMVESQWGTSYVMLPGQTKDDGSVHFIFASVTGYVETDLPAIATGPQNACAAVHVGSDKAGLFQKIIGTQTADECQEICGKTTRCRAALFDVKNSMCELMTSAGQLTNDQPTALVLPNCDSECFQTGKKLTAGETSLGTAPNPHICQAMCQAEASCQGFSWIRSTNACMAYDNDSDMSADENAVSGPRESCSPNTKAADYAGTCVQDDMSGTGVDNLMMPEGVYSFEQCHRLCLNEPKCNWLTYNKNEHKCYLKPERGTVQRNVLGDQTSPKLCDSSCFQKDVELTGDAIATIGESTSAHHCHYECSMNEDCRMWSWNSGGNKTCWLYGDSEVPVGRRAEGFWSGTRGACEGEEQYKDGGVTLSSESACAAVAMRADATASGLFQKVTNVQNANECQAACRGSMRCKAAVFDVETSTCEFMEGLRQLAGSKGKAVVLPICDGKCFTAGKKLTAGEASLGTAPNPHICQAMCQAEASCQGFSWIRTTRACMSYTSNSDMSADENAVSGPKESCSSNEKPADYAGTCVQDGTGNGADFGTISNVDSYGECRRLCLLDDRCNWFTYNTKDKRCYKKTQRGNLTTVKSGDVTSPKLCDSSCFQKDVELTGAKIATVSSIPYAQHCHYECAVKENCHLWSWNVETKLCSLYANSGVPSGRLAEGSWTGFRHACGADALYALPASECALRGVKYGGAPFAVLNVESAVKCQEACQDTAMCEAFAFDTKSNKCNLHLALAEEKKTKSSVFISGPKWCVSCHTDNSEYAGKALQEITSGVDTRDECQLRCQAKSGCTHWSYARTVCKLMSSDGSKSRTSGAVQGPKYCNWACDLNSFDAPSPAFGWISELRGKNRDSCRTECQKNKNCALYVFLENGNCYLKDQTALRHLTPKQGAITGFSTCSTCLRQGVGYRVDATALLWSLEAENSEECRQRCDTMENCTRFTYDAAPRTCSLLSGETGDEVGDTLTSGPANCSVDTSCFKKNSILKNNDNIAQAKVANAAACQALCASNVRCRFFTMSANKDCFLKSGIDGLPIEVESRGGWTSGNKKCVEPVGRCSEADYDYPFGDIYPGKPLSSSDPQQCMNWCNEEPQCRLWLLNKGNGRCWLKTIKGFSGRTTAASAEAGSRLGCAKCLRGGIEYSGPIVSKGNMPSETQCQLACELNAQCKYFTFVSGVCTLMSSMGIVKPAGSDTISGPKQC